MRNALRSRQTTSIGGKLGNKVQSALPEILFSQAVNLIASRAGRGECAGYHDDDYAGEDVRPLHEQSPRLSAVTRSLCGFIPPRALLEYHLVLSEVPTRFGE